MIAIELQVRPGSNRTAEAVRLDARGGVVTAITSVTRQSPKYETVLSAGPLERGGEAATVAGGFRHLLQVPEEWDVSAGGRVIVATSFGGAASTLMLVSENGTVAGIPITDATDNFANPRFVRRDEAPRPPITAIMDDQLVVYRASGERYGAYTRLFPAAEAVLVRRAGGYSAFFKPSAHGVLRTDGTRAGVVHHQRLDENFAPVGRASRPLGDADVFQFDADESDGVVLIAGTQEDGLIVALGLLGPELQPVASTRWDVDGIVNPAVLLSQQQGYFAVVRERVLVGGRILMKQR
jgi:hypothetical protein